MCETWEDKDDKVVEIYGSFSKSGCVQKVCVLDFEVCNDGVTREWTSKSRPVPGTDFLDIAKYVSLNTTNIDGGGL